MKLFFIKVTWTLTYQQPGTYMKLRSLGQPKIEFLNLKLKRKVELGFCSFFTKYLAHSFNDFVQRLRHSQKPGLDWYLIRHYYLGILLKQFL